MFICRLLVFCSKGHAQNFDPDLLDTSHNKDCRYTLACYGALKIQASLSGIMQFIC